MKDKLLILKDLILEAIKKNDGIKLFTFKDLETELLKENERIYLLKVLIDEGIVYHFSGSYLPVEQWEEFLEDVINGME
jgi:hypothetical protein